MSYNCSSKRAALVNHTILSRTDGHSSLPSIYEKDAGSQSHRSNGSREGHRDYPGTRSQSEPAIDMPQKRLKKKKKSY